MVRVRRLLEPEKDFSDRVVALARLTGWSVLHIHPLYGGKGRPITPAGADGKGYVDLTLFRERVVFAELKVGSNKQTPEQVDWERRIRAAGGEYYLWKPDDWDEIQAVLKRVKVPVATVDTLG